MNRFSGAIFVAPLLATAMFALGSFGAPWRGEWNWTIDSITGSTVLTGPLTAALGAYVALSQHRLAALAHSAPLGWQVPYRIGLQTWVLATLVYLVSGTSALLVTLAGPHGGPFAWWALGVGVLVLGACALLGAAAGHSWPSWITVVSVAPVVFLIGAFAPSPIADLLRHGPETGSLAGLRFDNQVLGAQSVALLAVSVCLCVALLPWSWGEWRTLHSALAAVSLVGMTGALVAVDQVGSERLVVSSERPTSCEGSHPRVCLAPSNQRELTSTARAMGRAAVVLAAGGVSVPDTYQQLLPSYHPPMDVGMVTLDGDPGDSGELRAGAANLMIPSACGAWTDAAGPPPSMAFDSQALLVEWVVMHEGGSPEPFNQNAAAWLNGAGRQEQNPWAIATFAALRRCELDSIRLPWPSATQ